MEDQNARFADLGGNPHRQNYAPQDRRQLKQSLVICGLFLVLCCIFLTYAYDRGYL